MYRNCVYSNRERAVVLFTWDAYGERVRQELPFDPYVYLEDKRGQERSIFGTPLQKKEFRTLWDKNKFVKESGVKRFFENLPPYQQFLIDTYYQDCGNDDFSKNPLKVMFFDLECPINEKDPTINEFPEPEFAANIIDLMTCYDSLSKKYTIFGLKPFKSERKDIIYNHCKSEEDLLKKFLKFFSLDYPDVLSTYNGASFDIPYLVNRINMVLGPGASNDLSPIGRIYEKINQEGKFGMPSKEYVIEGLSCLDYYVLYKKFTMNKLENHKLDTVAEAELNENKVDYEGSLADLCRNDWNTYVEYNIQDVEILVKLDDKLRYIELIRFIAYLGLCNMENAIKTVPVINGAIAIRARHRGEKIPTFIRPKIEGKIPGGYVAKPVLGFSNSVISFDANSLYPSVMISLNLSPETKLGRIEKTQTKDDKTIYNLYHVSGKKFELSPENFGKFLMEEKASLSAAGFLFSQKKMGIVPEFLDFLYAKRKEMKGKMSDLKKTLNPDIMSKEEVIDLKRRIQKYDTFQHAYKITLNSTYGYFASKFAPLGDDDIGASVTLTGQAAIKQSNETISNYVRDKHPEIYNINEPISIYNDTDSQYLSLKVFENKGICLMDGNEISEGFIHLCEDIEQYLNSEMNKWIKTKYLSADPRLVFKREMISDKLIFTGGKNYVVHVLDDEGVRKDKFKYVGVAVVKGLMPKAVKPYVKKITETMIMSQSLQQTNDLFLEAYEIFKSLGPDKTYVNVQLNNYDRYSKLCSGFSIGKGVPYHTKAAYWHDRMIEELKLTHKYDKFKSGDKVKCLYLKTPNRYGMDIIGFKGKYPTEFDGVFQVDFEKMFDKIMFSAIEKFFDVVNWKLRKPNENVRIELEDLLY